MQQLVRRRTLPPPASQLTTESWPWPVKIYTLGRFALLIDGKAPENSFKSPRKPLLLLKVLIALGGRDLKAEYLAYLLWPDADGDAGHHAFTTTLARLRSLLGYHRAVHLHDGKVSLDPRFCWVDRWAFERLCSQTEAALEQCREGKADHWGVEELAERAIRLYGGHFLRHMLRTELGIDPSPKTQALRDRLSKNS